MSQNYINHIVLVLDASSSMQKHQASVVKVADQQIQYLAQRSQEMDQETRITVYTFADKPKCVVWDKDVLRLPSIATLYSPYGNTALIDATMLALDDLALTPEKYGDHAFLAYVITDGRENVNRPRAAHLADRLRTLPVNWTVGVLVPNSGGVFEAKGFGFPADNIAVWDTTSAQGMTEVGGTIRQATESFMTSRASGVRGSKTLFSGGAATVNKQTVSALGLKPLEPSKYKLIHVPTIPEKTWISNFVRDTAGLPYAVGRAFYQLSKPEKIQAGKQVAVVEKGTDKVYVGFEARRLLGLPDTEVKVTPERNPQYTIFVQSMSVNRHLVPHTRLLLMV